MDIHTWLLYAAAALGLSLSPGPNSLLALTHGALHGRRKTMVFTLTGGALGFVLIIALSMFGIGALLKASLVWLTVLKWLGGAYLVWLGLQVWRSPPIRIASDDRADSADAAAPAPGRAMFRQGFLAAATNPKGILFFAAFLPQFVDPARPVLLQFALMAGTFVAIEFITELLLATLAQRITGWLARVGRAFNRVCGGLFVGIGVLLPLRA